MSRLRKNSSVKLLRGNNLFLSDENDIQYYLLHKSINKAIEIKLKQSYTKGYIDLTNIGLDCIPEDIFRLNYPIDGVKWWINVDFSKIDLSYNNLSEKSSHDFTKIPHVEELYLSFNKFNNIPIYIYYLKNLTLLDMSNNRITYIDENFCWNLIGLKNLDLSGNFIKYIPRSIKYMRNLEEVYLAKNEIIHIPNEIVYLKYLKILDLSWNKLQLIEPNIFNHLFCLEELYCNNNSITNIENINNYRVFDSIVNLKILDISNNQFQDFLVFRQIPNLKQINLSHNSLQNIFGLSSCEKLYDIDCSNNLLKEIPYDFLSVKNLHTLNVKFNKLNDLPAYLCLMDDLSEIKIDGNPMKNALNLKYANTFQIKKYLLYKLTEKDVIDMPEYLKKSYYKKVNDINGGGKTVYNKYSYIRSSLFNFIKNDSELVITNAELKEIPFDLIKYSIPFNFLTGIDLSGNLIEKGLENFVDVFYLLNNVKKIDFSRNKLRYFPIILLNLPNLEELYLSRNLLSVFPSKKIANSNYTNISPTLLILDLSNNQLEEFPMVIEFFKNLQYLNLSWNNIKNMNCLLYMHLENLEKFFIDNNRIYEIPHNILFRAIPNVKTFSIANNYLSDIPTDLSLLTFLDSVNFTGNFITKIPFEYLLDADDLKRYLKGYHVYSDEQRIFESTQEDKLRNSYSFSYSKKRMNKTIPFYHLSRNNNYLNFSFNKSNDIKRKIWDLTNYKEQNRFYRNFKNNLNRDYLLYKYVNGMPRNRSYCYYRDLGRVNDEIYEVESIMKNKKLEPYDKANLKKKFIGLIRERADLYK